MFNHDNNFGLGRNTDVYHVASCDSCDDHTAGVLLALWSDVPEAHQDALREAGYSLQYLDEYHICYDRNKAYRTEPDYWFWRPNIVFTDWGDTVTIDDDVGTILDDYAHEAGDTFSAQVVPHWITEADLTAHGFTRIDGTHYLLYQLDQVLVEVAPDWDHVVVAETEDRNANFEFWGRKF